MEAKTLEEYEIQVMITAVDELADIMLDSQEAYEKLEQKTAAIFGENPSERQMKAVLLHGKGAKMLVGKV